VRGLLERGEDVYILDWGYPDRSDRYLELEDYIQRFLGGAVDHLRREYRMDAINLLGICQGGAFSLCYASTHVDKVRNLITMVTPVDFHTPENLLTKWARHLDVEALVATLGNVPGTLLNALFLGLMPYRLLSQKYVKLLDRTPAPDRETLANFMRMEQWIFDSPDQAGEAFRQFITELVQANRLARGELQLRGATVDLRKIDMPVLNIYARHDHLVPPSASLPLQSLVGTRDYSTHEFTGGHIGIYVSGTAQREIPARIAGWLRERDAAA